VRLADAARLEAHVHSRQLGRHRQLAGGHLARPATGEDAVVRGGEGELQVRDRAGVGLGGEKGVRVLPLDRDVPRPRAARAARVRSIASA
jgi:hypothetical protein